MSRSITPRSASRSRSAGGSALANDTSVLGPRGATSRPHSARRAANRSASTRARRCTCSQPASLEHAERGEAARERLRAQREAVEAPRIRMKARREAGARVLQVRVPAPRHLQALLELGAHVEHAEPVGTAQPLLPGGGIRVDAERVHVHRHRAHALGTVEQDRHLLGKLGERGRRERPADPAHVGARDEPRLRRERPRKLLQGGHRARSRPGPRSPPAAPRAGRGAPRRS